MGRFITALLVLPMLLPATGVIAEEPPQTKDAKQQEPSYWMRKKIELSTEIMVGLAQSELDAVATHGQTMKNLTKIERWARRTDTKEYRKQLTYFTRANAELIRHAQEDDLDGAAVAFSKMTLSCVNCHKQLRP